MTLGLKSPTTTSSPATVSVVKTRHVVNTINVRSTRRVNTDALCLDLLQADWSPLYGANSTSDKWSCFLSTWSPIIDAHMPMRVIKLKHRPYPWLQDDDVREAMAARDQARVDRQLTPCDATEAEFRLRRNAVKVVLKPGVRFILPDIIQELEIEDMA
ncbi:hypothetical protein FJT64_023618 [Amphibalanus amphitrite]|uniref:Uncharacterized protein n=1 Tax=Amphibalanus amphitrite TaxID=1232801 RepID=A0A6A4WBA4_AMPAM|nr:hypothetical protein FJT64_023618 [Amphibalanus amphitrite]